MGNHSLTNGTHGSPTSPVSPMTPATSLSAHTPTAVGARGQNGTVRFMLDAARARREEQDVDAYFKVQEEEHQVEVPVETAAESHPPPPRRQRRR